MREVYKETKEGTEDRASERGGGHQTKDNNLFTKNTNNMLPILLVIALLMFG